MAGSNAPEPPPPPPPPPPGTTPAAAAETEAAPLLGSWPRWYALVLVALAVTVALFTALTRAYR